MQGRREGTEAEEAAPRWGKQLIRSRRSRIRRGSITIFMTLILSLLVMLTCAGLLAVRMAAARTQVLCGMDIGLYSLFAGYDRDLLREYDLFFLNGGHGGRDISAGDLCSTFRAYMEPVLRQNSQDLKLVKSGLTGYTLATDGTGTLFYRQAVEYRKGKTGIAGLGLLLEMLGAYSGDSQRAEELWNRAGEGQSLDSYEQEMERASQESAAAEAEEDSSAEPEEGSRRPVIVNPIPLIREVWKQGILGLVLPSDSAVSGKSIGGTRILSRRVLRCGIGSSASGPDMSLSNRVLFHEYILEKTGNYRRPSGKVLDYESEYILYGKDTDRENLKAVAKRLLLIREGINLSFLMTNGVRNAEAEALSLAISAGFLIPPAKGVIKTALLLCWSFAESILDLRSLFQGERIPAVKSEESWQLELKDLASFPVSMDACRRSSPEGLNYQDYFRILLWEAEERNCCMRTMDCVEWGIRSLGRENFYLDCCIGELGVWAEVKANGRKVLSVSREYAYR